MKDGMGVQVVHALVFKSSEVLRACSGVQLQKREQDIDGRQAHIHIHT